MSTEYSSDQGLHDNGAKAWAITAFIIALIALGWAIRSDLRAGDAMEAANNRQASESQGAPATDEITPPAEEERQPADETEQTPQEQPEEEPETNTEEQPENPELQPEVNSRSLPPKTPDVNFI
jgi:outer membrane biosynthesis protein TonB